MRDGWVETTFNAFASLEKGISYKSSELCSEGEGLPFINLKSIDRGGGYRSDGLKWYSGKYKSSQLVEPGDLILCCTDLTKQKAILGYPILVPSIGHPRFCISLDLAKIVVDEKFILKSFLFLLLQDHRMREFMQSRSSGTTVMHLKTSEVPDAQVALPPLPEQKRIVDLISTVDSYIEALQQQLESAKRSKGAVLHELLTVGGDDWVESTLGEIANWGSGGTPKADNPDFYDGEIPWCVIGDLTESEVWETEKRITNLGLSNSSAKVIDPGSVLLAMYGASIGRTGISAIPMATNQAIAFARCHPNLALPKYLLAYLQTQKTKFVEMGQGAAQPNISQTIIKSWPIDLPPIPYQNHLESTMDVFDATLFTLQSSIHSSKLLRSSLLSDLLSGEHEIPASYDKVMGAA
jgi:type I restriction enzyme S subunit